MDSVVHFEMPYDSRDRIARFYESTPKATAQAPFSRSRAISRDNPVSQRRDLSPNCSGRLAGTRGFRAETPAPQR